jgi:gliding motility-associated-like protein
VVFNPPYSTSNLLGGVPMTIDPQTGLLTATPNTIGQFVIGVCVNEYRNGVFLSKTRRDYQLNVVPCPSLVVAALQTPLLTCGSLNVQFTNNSFGAGSYLWNFGDPTTTADTSILINPSYLYPDTGLYNVTLIAYSIFNPGCADTTIGTVQLLPDYTADFSYSITPCSFTVNFNDTSNTDSGPTNQWLWNFGDGNTATTTDPSHTYAGPGTYTVTLQVTSSRGCKETIIKTVIVPPFLTAAVAATQVTCNDSCNGSASVTVSMGTPPYSYSWNDPQSQVTPTATGLCPGTYQVTITDSNGCTAFAQAVIGQPSEVTSATSSTDAYCNGACIGTASISLSGGTPPYSVVWNDPQNQNTVTATGLCPGWYTAVVTDVNGCPVTDSVEVVFSNYIPPLDATISQDTIYAGQTVNLNTVVSGGPFVYNWTPPASVSNPQIANPTSSPLVPVTYYVTITDTNGCENIDSVTVFVKEVSCEEPEIFIPNAFTPDGDSKNDKVFVRGNTIRELTLKIFDRWGELVFETNDPSIGWDGSYKGKQAAPAVYVYWLEATCYNEEKFFKKGNITLIR